MKLLRRITYTLARYYRPDLRALALMRIATALVLIADLAIRWQDLRAHYSDDGVWPTELAKTLGWKAGYWSMHTWTGAVPWQQILFLVHLLAAIGLLMGYRSTFCAFICWYLLVSLHNRNIYVLQAGDDLLRITLFFGMFLPWQLRYSVAQGRPPFFPANALMYFAYLLLIASVYFFSILLKTSAEWWSEGTAVYYALSLEQLRLPVTGDFLWTSPSVLKLITWTVLALEALIVVFIVLPSKSGRSRNLAFFLLIALHVGIGSTLYVGLFPFIAAATALGILSFRRKEKLQCAGFFSEWKIGRLTGAIAVLVIGMSLMMNLQGLPRFPYQMHSSLNLVANMLRLDQYWGMFSPSILKNDGWFVYQGVDYNNRTWDLRLDQAAVSFEKPARILSMYKNDRWRKLAENLSNDNFTFLRPLYARYVLREWSRAHPDRPMAYLHLYYVGKTNLPDYRATYAEKVLYCVTDGR